MKHLTLNFNNFISLKIPSDEEEIQLLKNQTGFDSLNWENSVPILEMRTFKIIACLSEIFKNLPNGATIVDIGSGNSLIDLALIALFPEKNFKFILVDSSEFDNKAEWPRKQYNENYITYNNWSFALKTIKLNNLPLENFTFLHPDDFKECNADVIMSFASCGWHYPLETYLDIIDAGLKKNGYVIFMPLMNTNDAVKKLNDRFGFAVIFNSFNFDKKDWNPFEANKILRQIESGELQKEPFGFNGIWHNSATK